MTDNSVAASAMERVIGPVVDVEFAPDEMPELFNALLVDRTIGEDTATLTLEVANHIGENTVRAISLNPTDGLVRGAPVTDTGAPISVPVGDVTKGHVFNALGQPLDVSIKASDTDGASIEAHVHVNVDPTTLGD